MTWTERAKIEIASSSRSWFGTLTIKPDLQLRAKMAARVRCAKSGVDFDTLGFGDQFAALHRETGVHVRDWLKRVRKEARTRFRYMVAAEYHKTGDPHYHFLLHELVGEDIVRKETMRSQWMPIGFSRFKLVEDGPAAARYVSKYLSKTNAARVRASRWYGRPWDQIRPSAVAEAKAESVKPVDLFPIPF